MSLLNKIAIITGASSGIGAATALKFVKESAKVVIVGRNEDKLKNVAAQCEENGNKPLSIIADIAKDEDATRVIEETVKTFGKLDVLVNNAGAASPGSILDPNALESFDKVMAINLRSIVKLINLAGSHLIESKGNIVNVSSVTGQAVFPFPGFAYSVSKAGVDHLTRFVAIELGAKGVRVNGINPGPVKTDILQNMGATGDQEKKLFTVMKKGTILDRISDSEEIADLILFLASDKGRSITGVNYTIDNGTFHKRA